MSENKFLLDIISDYFDVCSSIEDNSLRTRMFVKNQFLIMNFMKEVLLQNTNDDVKNNINNIFQKYFVELENLDNQLSILFQH